MAPSTIGSEYSRPVRLSTTVRVSSGTLPPSVEASLLPPNLRELRRAGIEVVTAAVVAAGGHEVLRVGGRVGRVVRELCAHERSGTALRESEPLPDPHA